MLKKIVVFAFLFTIPFTGNAQAPTDTPATGRESAKERVENIREERDATDDERVGGVEERTRNRVAEHVPERAMEAVANVVGRINEVHKRRMGAFFNYLSAISNPLDRLGDMIELVEENRGIVLDRTREALSELEEEFDEVVEDFKDYDEKDYELEEDFEDVVGGLGNIMGEMEEHHRQLRERVREVQRGIKGVMLTLREEVREDSEEEENGEEDDEENEENNTEETQED